MTLSADLQARLHHRAAAEGLHPSEELVQKLVAYLELLYRWNRRINLTSLTNPDEAIDRLLLEPLAAAEHLPSGARLADLGSGGGSPAIPLALATGATFLLLVESRTRKAAFLREASLEVGLNSTVEAERFEEVSVRPTYRSGFDVVTIRGVRHDAGTLSAAAELSKHGGIVALFRGPDGPDQLPTERSDLTWRETQPLLRSTRSRLTLLFHVEQP